MLLAVDDGWVTGHLNVADLFLLIAVILFTVYALVGFATRGRCAAAHRVARARAGVHRAGAVHPVMAVDTRTIAVIALIIGIIVLLIILL